MNDILKNRNFIKNDYIKNLKNIKFLRREAGNYKLNT